jgi:hypothetical protein
MAKKGSKSSIDFLSPLNVNKTSKEPGPSADNPGVLTPPDPTGWLPKGGKGK